MGAVAEEVGKMAQKLVCIKNCLPHTVVKSFYNALKYSPRVPSGGDPEKISASGTFMGEMGPTF